MNAFFAAEGRLPALRQLLAFVAAFDLVALAFFIGDARERAGGAATGGVIAFASAPPVRLALSGIGLAGAALFARRAGHLVGGAVALVALALLSHTHAALFGSPWRHLFFVGACLLGWLAGLAYARARQAPHDERYARVGAVAVLGATYFNAGLSKLVYGGVAWTSGLTLRHSVITQDGLTGDGLLHSLRETVVDNPSLAGALAIVTIVVELGGALFLVGPRVRAIVALGIVGMHVSILALTGILYAESIVLLLALGLPFAKDDAAPEIAPLPVRTVWIGAVVLLAVGAAGIFRQATETAPEYVDTPVQATVPEVGPFRVGELIAGWTLVSIEMAGEGYRLSYERGDATVRFDLTCGDVGHGSIFDDGPAHILYLVEDVPMTEVQDLGFAIRETSRGAVGPNDACATWAEWREHARRAAYRP